MRSKLAVGLVGFLGIASAACDHSPVQPRVEIQAETVGVDFVADGRAVAIPVTLSNVSSEVTTFVWTAPGGLCARIARLDLGSWREGSSGECHPSSAVALAPGERLGSEVLMPAEAGVFRLGIRVSHRTSVGTERYEPTNAFTIRPE